MFCSVVISQLFRYNRDVYHCEAALTCVRPAVRLGCGGEGSPLRQVALIKSTSFEIILKILSIQITKRFLTK